MELQSLSINTGNSVSSLAIQDNSQKLASPSSAAIQQLQSHERESLAVERTATSVQTSSVVTQLVAGADAAVAVYGQFPNISNDIQPNSPAPEANIDTAPSLAETVSSEINVARDLQQAELKITQQLASRDREVRAHEQTHASIGGAYAGAPSFDFTSGPDGQLYATSGQVSIDTSAIENNPEATLEKAQIIIRAALSVSEPSAADRKIAAEAKSLAMRALSDIRESDGSSINDVSSVARDAQVKLEQQQLEREEFLAEAELKEAKQERNQALLEARKQSTENSMAVLTEYNKQISDIQETLRRLNTQLVDSGAFSKSFPEGFLIDQSV
ncbi:MAG: hypothetical protein HRU05_11315 [Oceanospirillaceae bacterium]|nr:hypothetical protein [Oceanospirillaceae bacterium]